MCSPDEVTSMPLIGEKAPSFIAETTQGTINFPGDYEGKWVIFFSHLQEMPARGMRVGAHITSGRYYHATRIA